MKWRRRWSQDKSGWWLEHNVKPFVICINIFLADTKHAVTAAQAEITTTDDYVTQRVWIGPLRQNIETAQRDAERFLRCTIVKWTKALEEK